MPDRIVLPRRKFLIGAAASLLAAPAIVRASSLMKVRPLPLPAPAFGELIFANGSEVFWYSMERDDWLVRTFGMDWVRAA